MKFNIKKLIIQNFRSIQKPVELEFKAGLYSIEGINLDEPSSTNGSGKSTLISALYWCLTGNTLTNEVLADEVVNLKSGKDCKVTLYLETKDDTIKIIRTRKDSELGNSLFLYVNDQDLSCHKIAETQQHIDKLITLPFDILSSTIIMTSDMKSAFSELSPQQRIQMLESIRDYSLWDKVRDEANKDIKAYNKEIQDKKLAVSSLNGSIITYQKMLDTQTALKEKKELSFDANEITIKIQNLEQENLLLKNDISNLESKIAVLKNKEFVNNSEILTEMNIITEKANDLLKDKQQKAFDVLMLKKEIETIEKWFKEDTCPTCHRKLERNEQDIIEKEKLKKDNLNKIISLENTIKEIDNAVYAFRKEWSDKNHKITEVEQIKKQTETEISAYNTEMINKINIINTNKNKIYSLTSDKNNFANEINKLDSDILEYKNKISELTTEVLKINDEIKKIEYKCNLSTYYYKLLGNKGELRPYLLNKDIQYLNSCMQKYIIRFFKNTDVNLYLNGSAIDISITCNGFRKSISSLSGGEKKRLNLSIQLALYDLIKSIARVEFNTLFLDEVESQLDPLGCQQLIEIIEDKSEEIENVFWITNSSMVKENIQNKIICKKTMGVTEVYAE